MVTNLTSRIDGTDVGCMYTSLLFVRRALSMHSVIQCHECDFTETVSSTSVVKTSIHPMGSTDIIGVVYVIEREKGKDGVGVVWKLAE